jgi:hypothetical protein
MRCGAAARASKDSFQVIDPQPLSAGQASGARLLRRFFDVDPLSCPKRGSEMVIVSVITTPCVIDEVLRHVRKTGKDDLWGPGPSGGVGLPSVAAPETGRTGDGLLDEGWNRAAWVDAEAFCRPGCPEVGVHGPEKARTPAARGRAWLRSRLAAIQLPSRLSRSRPNLGRAVGLL